MYTNVQSDFKMWAYGLPFIQPSTRSKRTDARYGRRVTASLRDVIEIAVVGKKK
jgi:hypothetical protein